jgi:hypothetical protein
MRLNPPGLGTLPTGEVYTANQSSSAHVAPPYGQYIVERARGILRIPTRSTVRGGYETSEEKGRIREPLLAGVYSVLAHYSCK